MSKYRLLLANTVIVFIILGSLYCIVLDREYWPFSQYPMFSNLRGKSQRSLSRLYGITKDNPNNEVPLFPKKHLQPFDESQIKTALGKIHKRKNSETLLNAALKDCLRRYEALREAGDHKGPPLEGIRLYRLRWQLDDERTFQPDKPRSRKRLAQVLKSKN